MPLNRQKIILDLCGGTGSWSKPYTAAGYDVRLITLPDTDVVTYIPPDGVHGVLAAPPCTEFSFAKHLHGKGNYSHDFPKGLAVVDACLRIIWRCSPNWWALENPRGYLRRFLGLPPLTFDPYDYGDKWQKKTDLWGCYAAPLQSRVEPTGKKFSLLKIGELRDLHGEYGKMHRSVLRAITPPGFARAFFEANK